MHIIDIFLEFGTAESLFVFCRIGANYTKKRHFWTPWYDPYQAWYGSYQTWTIQPFSHLVRPGRTTLVRAVHRCRLAAFKFWQRLYIAGDLSIFKGWIPDQIESSEKERKRAKEQGGKTKEEERGESRRINPFSTPDLRSSSIMLFFISFLVFLDRSMTCE